MNRSSASSFPDHDRGTETSSQPDIPSRMEDNQHTQESAFQKFCTHARREWRIPNAPDSCSSTVPSRFHRQRPPTPPTTMISNHPAASLKRSFHHRSPSEATLSARVARATRGEKRSWAKSLSSSVRHKPEQTRPTRPCAGAERETPEAGPSL